MKVIDGYVTFETEIKKSKFICNLKYVDNVCAAKNFILEIKQKNNTASHNCSCYIIGANQKADDDNEPSKTAGLPMLEVLKLNDCNNVACVVTRYFGGIKLGHGGLIRAYSKSVSNAIHSKPLLEIAKGIEFEIEFLINHVSIIDHFLKEKNVRIVKKNFSTNVCYILVVLDDQFLTIKNQIIEKANYVKFSKEKEVNYFKESNE